MQFSYLFFFMLILYYFIYNYRIDFICLLLKNVGTPVACNVAYAGKHWIEKLHVFRGMVIFIVKLIIIGKCFFVVLVYNKNCLVVYF